MVFKNRREAGRLLGEKLLEKKYGGPKTVIIGLLRGGVPVAYEVAAILKSPLDVALVRKIGAPDQQELAIGAIVDGESPQVYLNESLLSQIGVPDEYIEKMKKEKLEEIREREKMYRKGRSKINVKGKIALIVDDGIATGASVRAVAKSLKKEGPKKVVIAVPVLPLDSVEELKKLADDVIYLSAPEPFYAVGEFYSDFSQTTDEEVTNLLDKSKM